MKKAAVIAACLLLAGCGFHPMYGTALAPEMSSIFVEQIAERDGYELRTALIDLLNSDGREGGKKYRLKIVLSEASQGIALQNDATITRYNNTLSAKYELTDAGGRLEYMNPIAERLTGCSTAEARGLPLISLFSVAAVIGPTSLKTSLPSPLTMKVSGTP